jgi:uncharacterized membrane protein (Fun14 family)
VSEELDEREVAEPSADAPRGLLQRIGELARWQKVLLACSVASIALGLCLELFGGGEEPTPVESAGASGAGVAPQATSLVPTTPDGPASGEAPAPEDASAGGWSPFFVKGGFSFFFGFCVGYALRAFFKVSAIALGVIFLALLGLQQVGFVEIRWDAISAAWDGTTAKLSDELESIKTFLTGSLPSAALGGLGLFAGFKGKG